MKRSPVQPAVFFSRHRLVICAILFSCAMMSVLMGHKLSVAYSKPATAETPPVETASAGHSAPQG